MPKIMPDLIGAVVAAIGTGGWYLYSYGVSGGFAPMPSTLLVLSFAPAVLLATLGLLVNHARLVIEADGVVLGVAVQQRKPGLIFVYLAEWLPASGLVWIYHVLTGAGDVIWGIGVLLHLAPAVVAAYAALYLAFPPSCERIDELERRRQQRIREDEARERNR